ncbi:hypothetical protein QWA68_000196 [Fusarium oxysporum]|nr:hypothetical protein QWA68_000196 [Fusarium oxysporum]
MDSTVTANCACYVTLFQVTRVTYWWPSDLSVHIPNVERLSYQSCIKSTRKWQRACIHWASFRLTCCSVFST